MTVLDCEGKPKRYIEQAAHTAPIMAILITPIFAYSLKECFILSKKSDLY